MKRCFVPILLLFLAVFALIACQKPGKTCSSAFSLDSTAPLSSYEGQLVHGTTPEDQKLYIIKDGKRHWVTSAAWLRPHGYSGSVVRVISADRLARFPEGTSYFADVSPEQLNGMLVRRPGNSAQDVKLFFIKDGKKHWVSGPWLHAHDYHEFRYISGEQLAQFPEGEPYP